jgi:biotin synthase-related radical SAM superfamily protein
MSTFNKSQQKAHQLEEFLNSLEREEAADDIPVEEIEAGEAAYQEYKDGRDSGKSLEQLKAELGC